MARNVQNHKNIGKNPFIDGSQWCCLYFAIIFARVAKTKH